MTKRTRAWTAGIALAVAIAAVVGVSTGTRQDGAPGSTPEEHGTAAPAQPAGAAPNANPTVAAATADERRDLAALLGDGTRRQRLADIDPHRFAHEYGALANLAAQGDVRAAVALSLGVQICEPAPADARDLEGMIREIQFRATPGDADTADEIARARTLFDACKPLSPAQRRSHRDWIVRAAELGDADARFRFADLPPERATATDYWAELDAFRTTANRYLDDELAKGNRKALLAISNAYRDDSQVRRPDPVLEYAYLHAYLAAGGEQPDEEVQVLEQYQQRLGPARAKEAVRLGEAILREHYG